MPDSPQVQDTERYVPYRPQRINAVRHGQAPRVSYPTKRPFQILGVTYHYRLGFRIRAAGVFPDLPADKAGLSLSYSPKGLLTPDTIDRKASGE